jgi:hypothetical protein
MKEIMFGNPGKSMAIELLKLITKDYIYKSKLNNTQPNLQQLN